MSDNDENEKTHEELQREAAARAEAAREATQEAAVADAEDRAAQAQKEAGELAAEECPKKGKSAGTDPDYTESESLHDHHIAEGQAPLDPGPEQPVDPDEGKQAKENRGR
jgi:hypothetical protein